MIRRRHPIQDFEEVPAYFDGVFRDGCGFQRKHLEHATDALFQSRKIISPLQGQHDPTVAAFGDFPDPGGQPPFSCWR